MPGLPGTPGRPGIDGKRGLPAKDGASGPKGDDGKKGDKGDAGANGKDGSKGEPGPPGLPGRQVLVTPEGATIDEIRQAFPIPMGPPGATGSPGIKGDKGEYGLKGNKGDAGAPGKSVEMKDIEVMFEAYGIRLPLLKALIDRLLQDGIEELLHVLGTSKKSKENTQTHTSNVITEYTSSVKFDLTDQPLSELDTIEDPDLDGQLPESLSADPLNETGEGPTLWTVTTLNGEHELDRIETKLKGSRGKEVVDGDSDGASSLKINLTVVNSTFNSTTSQETVSGLPETVVETVLLTQEDSLKKNLGQKKKNRERGKTSEEDKQDEEEEFYNTEEYSYEYEEEVSTDDPSVSQERRDNRHLEAQTDEFPHAVDKKVALTNTGPLSQPMGDIKKDQDEVSLPTPPITTEEPDKGVS